MSGWPVIATANDGDWTTDPATGRPDSSPEFELISMAVAQLIRDTSHDLIARRSDSLARLIVAELAHKHGLAPHSAACVAGRPFPDGAVTIRTRWRAYSRKSGGAYVADDRVRVETHIANTADMYPDDPAVLQSSREMMWRDGSRFIGPWIDAPAPSALDK